MNKLLLNWLIFALLSLIWGSSFILIKIGLDNHLTAYQVAAIRIVAAGAVFLPVAIKSIKQIPANKLGLVFIAGLMGNLLPSFLFCIAEEGIDSSLAGTLNCLTPIFVILTGTIFFNTNTSSQKIIGIIVAFAGSFLLLLSKGEMQQTQHIIYVLLVVLATFLYGFNVNMVSKHLLHLGSFNIAAVALVLNAIPALIVLILSGYFALPFNNTQFLIATGAASLLGLMSTSFATIIFYKLVKSAGGIFASMVTYGVPFIAISWGIYYGESFGWKQVFCLLIILTGVFIVNLRKKVVIPS
ncbi:MAG: DMT family transporter [Ferruginibacter sp.]